jgi:diguanylate cyclase (GGDEF)-like protein
MLSRTASGARHPGARRTAWLSGWLRRRPGRVHLVTAAVVIAAAAATVAIAHLPTRPAPFTLPWPALAGLFALAEICVVNVEFRREAQAFSLSEIPLVIGLFFDPPLAVVLSYLLGAAIALTLYRRQSWLKLAFNLGNFTLAAAVTEALFAGLAPHRDPTGAAASVAALLAMTVAGALQTAIFVVTILASEGRIDRSGIAATSLLSVLGTVINICVAMVAVNLMWFHAEVIWLLAVPVAGVTVAYRTYVAERENRKQLAFLYDSSRQLQAARDVDEALVDVLTGSCETFRAERAEVIIFPSHDGEVMIRLGVGPEGSEPMQPLAAGLEERRFVTSLVTAAPALLDVEGDDPEARRFLEREGIRDGMVAVLRGETRPVGLMIVGNRLSEVSGFDEEDLRLFEMLAAHTGSTLENGRLEHSLRQLTDLQHKLRHQALHDPLTGMANRALFQSNVRDAVADGGGQVGVLFIDLDDFKTVNDSLGHLAGDELLRAVAGRVCDCLRPTDLAARLGGDEFAVLLRGIADSRAATAVASRIVKRLRDPFQVMGCEIMVRASIGIATGTGPEFTADELLRNADEAMYTAKGLGKGRWELFAPSMHAAVLSRHEFKADLHRALERDELVVHYQPMFETPSGEVAAAEALLRWRHPRHGLIQPSDFIGLAEETGLIAPIGRWVLERACQEAVAWRGGAGRHVPVAVNVSPRQLQRGAFIDEVRNVLARTGLPPRDLILEVTESAAIEEVEAATGRLQQLRDLGIRIALDDFGTGHSSLSRLRDFPVDVIKIDKAFTATLGPKDGGGLSHAVFAFSHSLGVTVVAEGVEDLSHLRALDAFPRQWAQGYHLAPPLEPEALLDLLARRSGEAADGARILQLRVS